MSGRGEPAGCHGDVLKGGLCARLSCAARIPAPAPHPPGRPVPLGPARQTQLRAGSGALRAGALSLQGLGSSPGLWGVCGAV